MANLEACKQIRKTLTSQFKRAFGENLEDHLTNRGQELWIIGIDTKLKTFVDRCGTIDPADLNDINSKGFFDTDAGYRVDAQNALGLGGKKVDIFLLNKDHYENRLEYVEPIIVHELAHLLEQCGQVAQPQHNDQANATAILASLRPELFRPVFRHNEQWALHLAIGARTVLSKGLTKHATIRAYLEAAVPSYDRKEGIKATKGWP